MFEQAMAAVIVLVIMGVLAVMLYGACTYRVDEDDDWDGLDVYDPCDVDPPDVEG